MLLRSGHHSDLEHNSFSTDVERGKRTPNGRYENPGTRTQLEERPGHSPTSVFFSSKRVETKLIYEMGSSDHAVFGCCCLGGSYH